MTITVRCSAREHAAGSGGAVGAYPTWIICHGSHASCHNPEDGRTAFLLDDVELQVGLDRLTDHAVDELVVPPGAKASTVAAAGSRCVVDVERFVEADREPISRVGIGAICTRATDGRSLQRELVPEEELRLPDRYYHPHLRRLAGAGDRP